MEQSDFGFTNDKDIFEWVKAFRDDAVNDGWVITSTYPFESIDRVSNLSKDGFKLMILSRDNSDKNGKWKYEAQVNAWGNDGMVIRISLFQKYLWDYLVAGLRKCKNCGSENVDTFNYSFAGRCCAKCLPEMKKKHEYPGWCD